MSKILKCNECDKVFRYNSEFKRHKNRKTPCKKRTINVQKYKCFKCNKIYVNKSSLNRHLRYYCKAENVDKNEHLTNPSQTLTTFKNSLTNPSQTLTKKLKCDEKKGKTSICKNRTLQIEHCKCAYCAQVFTRKDNLNRHLKKYCKIKKRTDKEKEKIFKRLLFKVEQMESKIDVLQDQNFKLMDLNSKSKTDNTIKNTQNVNSNNNNIDNSIKIQLVAYGKENKDDLTNNELYHILKRGFFSVPELIKAIHFNKNRPENHNIYIPNMRANYAMVYDGDDWGLVDKKETVDDMFENGRDYLVVKYEDLKQTFSERQKKATNKFAYFDYAIDYEKGKKEQILKNINFILYNKKNMVLKKNDKDLK